MLALSLNPLMGATLTLAAVTDPSKLPGTGPHTFAGQNSDSLGGYLFRRTLDGMRATVTGSQTLGHQLYNYNPDYAAQHFKYEVLDPNPDPDSLKSAHEKSHDARLGWAQNLAKDRYALHSSAGQGEYRKIYQQLITCNGQFRSVWDDVSPRWNPELSPDVRHRVFARPALEGSDEIMKIVWRANNHEMSGQISGYQDLIGQLAKKGKPLSIDEGGEFNAMLQSYESAVAEEQSYSEALNAGEEGTSEYKRKKLEKVSYDRLQELHRLVKRFYQLRFNDTTGLEAPLTFRHKTQSYFIGRGPVDTWPLEVFLETTWNLSPEVDRLKRGELTEAELHEVGSRLFGVQMMAYFYNQMRLAVPPGVPVFGNYEPAEAKEIQGYQQLQRMMASASEVFKIDNGVVASWPHTGPLDYNANLGLSYLLGLPWAAIVAEKAFRFIPILRAYLLATTGGFLDRSSKKSMIDKLMALVGVSSKTGIDAAYELMARRLAEDLMVILFPTGTREFDFPLVSPYADLTKEAILHLPGEYVPSRHPAAMLTKVATENKKPIMVVSANLARGGIPEPNIPRTAGEFLGSNNMFHYARPGEEDGFVAIADVLPYESLIKAGDFPGLSEYEIHQLNLAIVMWREWMVGRQMDAGPLPI